MNKENTTISKEVIRYPEEVDSAENFTIDFTVWKVYKQTGTGRYNVEVKVSGNSAGIIFPRKKISLRSFFKLAPVKGDEYSAIVHIEHSLDYGESIWSDSILDAPKIPQTLKTACDFLEGHVEKLGHAQAYQIVSQLGTNAIEKIKNDPNILDLVHFKRKLNSSTKVKIISISDFGSYIQSLQETLSVINAPAELAVLLYNKFGIESLSTINRDPYVMTDVLPKAWYFADAWQHRLDPAGDLLGYNKHRTTSAIKYALEILSAKYQSLSIPHAVLTDFVTSDSFLANFGAFPLSSKNTVSLIDFKLSMGELIKNKKIIDESDSYYLITEYKLETSILSEIKKRMSLKLSTPDQIDSAIALFETNRHIKLSNNQRKAIHIALSSPLSILTGGPGTGKTLVVSAISFIARTLFGDEEVVLAAPTGKAARRLSNMANFPANTLHRTLGIKTFAISPTVLIHNKLFIVDESSMITAQMFLALLQSTMSEVRLLLVGDDNQLPAIGKGSILKDLIHSKKIPVTELDTVFRQGLDSIIPENAFLIQKGIGNVAGNPKLTFQSSFKKDESNSIFIETSTPQQTLEKTIGAFCSLWKKYQYPLNEVMVLSAKKSGIVGVDRLNREIQKIVNPLSHATGNTCFVGADQQLIYKSDTVMQIENDNRTGITNGSLGKVIELSPKAIVVKFSNFDTDLIYSYSDALSELVLGYALTVHKSQGSETENVVQVVDQTQRRMLSRALIYTGYTRAEKNHIFVGQNNVLKIAIKNNLENLRPSNLGTRLLRDL